MQLIPKSSAFNTILNGKKGYLHLLFWGGHFIIRILISRYHSYEFWPNFWIEATELPIKIIISYLTIYLVERYIKEWQIPKFLIGLAGSFMLCWILKRLHDWYVVFPIYEQNSTWFTSGFWDAISGTRRMIYIYPNVVGLLAMTYTGEWFLQLRNSRLLKQKQQESELKYLKSQIHPHFLFNTLNNLYGLSLKNSEKTPEVILQLSEFLSFMLYQAEKEIIPLKTEVELIVNLYSLESLRTANYIDFQFLKPHPLPDVHLPPLLLFPLAENAFKYGIGDEDAPNSIILNLEVTEHTLTFTTQNHIRTHIKSDQTTEKGFGLHTLKQRLQLLYPETFTLEHYCEEDVYFARLIIPLKTSS